MKKFVMLLMVVLIAVGGMTGCRTDADVASHNLSKKAEMFEVTRRIIFINGITDSHILSVEGLCSVEFKPLKFEVTCKVGEKEFLKHYLGRADNVFPFVEQIQTADVSTNRYKVIFKPSVVIPDIDVDLPKEGETF